MPINYLALDVGGARIGLALANDIARIAAPLPAVSHDGQVMQSLQAVISDHNVSELVVGWPRGLNGQETAQTKYVAHFSQQLATAIAIEQHHQDEAVTSVQAEAELHHRASPFSKADIDSLSAVYILEDFLNEQQR